AKELPGGGEFRTVRISVSPDRQELFVSRSCRLVVAKKLRCSSQSKNRFRPVRRALQRSLEVDRCLSRTIESEQQIPARPVCGDRRIGRLGEIVERVFNGNGLLKFCHGVIAITSRLSGKSFCLSGLKTDDQNCERMLSGLLGQ